MNLSLPFQFEMPKNVDYSLYLVTDSTPAILAEKDLVSVVKEAVEGGKNILCLSKCSLMS